MLNALLRVKYSGAMPCTGGVQSAWPCSISSLLSSIPSVNERHTFWRVPLLACVKVQIPKMREPVPRELATFVCTR